MKIERISDNQIRCTLNKEDLEGKETLLSELAFGSEKAKGLFRELMNKAATELGFETNEDNPLMVEAIPVSKECLILVITRVDNPEDFREHYKKLPKSLLAAKLLSDYNVASTLYKDPDNQCYYLSLTALDDSPNNDSMDEIHLVLSEYCKRLPNTYATKALFNEHLTTIIEKQAVEEMAAY